MICENHEARAATDLDSGEEAVIYEGPVYRTVRASISVPGVFEPYRLRGRLLVDGGMVNPMPVSVARRKGADLVVAVQVPAPGKAAEASETYVSRQLGTNHNLLWIMVRTYYVAGDELAKRGATEADLLIRPNVAHFGLREYRSAPTTIRCGYQAAQEAARIRPLWWGTVGVS